MHLLEPMIESIPDPAERRAEFVECKGPGHPDTLCDAVAESVSRALSRTYLERFGRILHHNVDKVLLVGGESMPRFGGGRCVSPIRIVIAGRATARVGSDTIPIDTIAREAGASAVRASVRHLDPDRHVTWETRIRPGSADLAALFARGAVGEPLANDSSAGAGFAPLSPLERLVRDATALLAAAPTRPSAACGEDVKVAGIRRAGLCSITVACAAIDHGLDDLTAYRGFRDASRAAVASLARERLGDAVDEITINAADDLDRGECYLTVTGSSAESGDDGETGRGNRVNGLIAVGRPMSMEATAGKNAVSHVGKLYNVIAQELAEELVAAVPGVTAAECILASRIGSPVSRPALTSARIALRRDVALDMVADDIRERIAAAQAGAVTLWRRIVSGEVRLF